LGALEETLTPGGGKEGGDVIFSLHKSVVLFIEAISAYSLCDKFNNLSTQQQQETVALYTPSLPPDPYSTAALLLSHSATLERMHPPPSPRSLSLTPLHRPHPSPRFSSATWRFGPAPSVLSDIVSR